MSALDVVVLGSARTPIGRYGGSFRDLHPAELRWESARAFNKRSYAVIPSVCADDTVDPLVRELDGAASIPDRRVGARLLISDLPDGFQWFERCA